MQRSHRETLRLRDFVLVVREGQIDAARVNVQRIPQVPPGHRAALDVPPGSSLPQRSFPKNVPVLGLVRLRLFVSDAALTSNGEGGVLILFC